MASLCVKPVDSLNAHFLHAFTVLSDLRWAESCQNILNLNRHQGASKRGTWSWCILFYRSGCAWEFRYFNGLPGVESSLI